MSTTPQRFEWPEGNPSNEAEFERLMWALDKHLAEQRGQPLYRLMGLYIEDALQESGLDWGNTHAWRWESAGEPGYTGQALVAKAHQWYARVYGEKVSGPNAVGDMWSVGFIPVKLGNEAVWKLRIPLTMTWPQFVCDTEDFKGSGGDNYVSHDAKTVNVLRLVENLPSKLVDYMSEAEQAGLTTLCDTAMRATDWLRGAAKTLAAAETVAEKKKRALFQHARQDYVSSTANLLHYNFSQSRWSSSQAIEKIMKGVLGLAGKQYSTNGRDGHNLLKMAEIMEKEIKVTPKEDCVKVGMWPASARYDDTKTTLDECLQANHAVLKIAEQFSEDKTVEQLLASARAGQESAVPEETE